MVCLDIVAAISLFDRRPFLRPDLSLTVRRAQPRSRLAVALAVRQAVLPPGHALTAASTTRGLRGAGWRRAMSGGTWSWTGPWMRHAEAPHHLVSGRARWPGTL